MRSDHIVCEMGDVYGSLCGGAVTAAVIDAQGCVHAQAAVIPVGIHAFVAFLLGEYVHVALQLRWQLGYLSLSGEFSAARTAACTSGSIPIGRVLRRFFLGSSGGSAARAMA